MFTFRVFCRRDSVLKSGTTQPRPISCSRLSTNPPLGPVAFPWLDLPERLVVARPGPGPVGRAYRSAHAPQLPRWIHDMKPLTRFEQQSRSEPRKKEPFLASFSFDQSDLDPAPKKFRKKITPSETSRQSAP
jgi:hypothetical protein